MNQQTDCSKKTLHLLSLSPKYWHSILENIRQIWQTGDMLLLLAESAQGITDTQLDQFDHIAILQNDADLLTVQSLKMSTVKVISYDEWAELTLQFTRTITWR
jgi:hypothetical protein